MQALGHWARNKHICTLAKQMLITEKMHTSYKAITKLSQSISTWINISICDMPYYIVRQNTILLQIWQFNNKADVYILFRCDTLFSYNGGNQNEIVITRLIQNIYNTELNYLILLRAQKRLKTYTHTQIQIPKLRFLPRCITSKKETYKHAPYPYLIQMSFANSDHRCGSQSTHHWELSRIYAFSRMRIQPKLPNTTVVYWR